MYLRVRILTLHRHNGETAPKHRFEIKHHTRNINTHSFNSLEGLSEMKFEDPFVWQHLDEFNIHLMHQRGIYQHNEREREKSHTKI